ncbi:MAG TPA: AMP-binding protein [Bryobacteraceae bacterium]|nr:AMP-binding protein [Bryobacteraceae bacterium]
MTFRSPWHAVQSPFTSVCEAVWAAARDQPEKPALIEADSGHSLTYAQLANGADRVAAGLARAGLATGQGVAVALPNSINFALAWFGATRAGGWVVPLNPLYTVAELEQQIRDSGARLLIAAPDRAHDLAGVVEQVFAPGSRWNELTECQDPPPDVRMSPQDLAAMPYSSGTTGKPKGVMLTHGNICANIEQFVALAGIGREDVVVNMFPLYHVGGLNGVLNTVLAVGGTIVLMRRFDLEGWLTLIEKHCGTYIIIPPPVAVAVAKSPMWDRFRLNSLRNAACGAAPLGADMQKAFEERTGLVLRQVWGMSEGTAVVSCDSGEPSERRFGSCGRLAPGIEAQVVDIVSQSELGPAETGEIWLRGPNIMQGYWRHPTATSETMAGDGWMRTGDIGYFDSQGYVYLVDRLKEMIKYNAQQVAPAELEDVIQTHPAVLDAAVVGAPDESAGEIPMAFVVPKTGAVLDAADLMNYVAIRVAPHKKIRAVEFVDAIPKTTSGKILRRVLKDRIRARAAG